MPRPAAQHSYLRQHILFLSCPETSNTNAVLFGVFEIFSVCLLASQQLSGPPSSDPLLEPGGGGGGLLDRAAASARPITSLSALRSLQPVLRVLSCGWFR